MFPSASMPVGQLLGGPFFFDVPSYQRPFDWTEKQALQLVDDLLESANFRQKNDAYQGYFLGTILLMDQTLPAVQKISPKMAARTFDLVDGHQRVVTILTIIAVLRDIGFEDRGARERKIEGIMAGNAGSRFFQAKRQRLIAFPVNRRTFDELILPKGATARSVALDSIEGRSNRQLIEVRDDLRTYLSDMPASTRQMLFDYLINECHVIVLVSNDIDRAHRLFVVLNERGKQLHRKDILKADLLSRLPPAHVNDIARRWDKLSERLDTNFEPLFSHLRTMYGETRPQIVAGIRNLYQKAGGPKAFFDNLVEPLGEYYALIKADGGNVLPPDLRRVLRGLNRLTEGDWAPAAIFAVKLWHEDPTRGREALLAVDRLAHLLRLRAIGSPRRVAQFAGLVTALREGKSATDFARASALTDDDLKKIAYHLRDPYKRDGKFCKLLLIRIGDELADRDAATELQDYTVEHVLPRRIAPTSDWAKAFPTPEIRDRCTESIGNLALVSTARNGAVRSKEFAEKCAILSEEDPGIPLLEVTRDLLAQSTWTPEVVLDREQRLLSVLERIWRIDLDRVYRKSI